MKVLVLLFVLYSLAASLAEEFENLDFEPNLHLEQATFWNDYILNRNSKEVNINRIPSLESIAAGVARSVADIYSRNSPVQPSAAVVEKLNKYYNPSAENYVDVDMLGNTENARAYNQEIQRDQRELVTSMFDFSKQNLFSSDSSDGLGATIPSLPTGGLFNRTLGPTCSTKYCELIQTALSCKALKIHMSKTCAKYFVGLVIGCPKFPDKYHLQDAPVSCQVEFANAAANLAAAVADPTKSFLFEYAFSNFDENCKRRCYQKFQQQSIDFFYGSECRDQVSSVVSASIPVTAPSYSPTMWPTAPTFKPTASPTGPPSFSPTASPSTSFTPTVSTLSPSTSFSPTFTAKPTIVPTIFPTLSPSTSPTISKKPTENPTFSPSASPTTPKPTNKGDTNSPTTAYPTQQIPPLQKYPFILLMWNFRMFRNQACTSTYPLNESPTPTPTATPTVVSPTTISPSVSLKPTESPTTASIQLQETDCFMKVSGFLNTVASKAAESGGGGGLPYDCFASVDVEFEQFVLFSLYEAAFKDLGCCYGTIIQMVQQAQLKPTELPFLFPPCVLRYMYEQAFNGSEFAVPTGKPLSPTNVCPLGSNANLSITTFTLSIGRQVTPALKAVNVIEYMAPTNKTGNLVLMTAINAALSNVGLALGVDFQQYPYYFPNYLRAYSTNIGIYNFQYYDKAGRPLLNSSYIPNNIEDIVAEAYTVNISVTIGFQGNIIPDDMNAITATIQSPGFTIALGGTQNGPGILQQVVCSLHGYSRTKCLQYIGSSGIPRVSVTAKGKGTTQFTSVMDPTPTTPKNSGFSYKDSQKNVIQALTFAVALFFVLLL